jgi:hypothetical protein
MLISILCAAAAGNSLSAAAAATGTSCGTNIVVHSSAMHDFWLHRVVKVSYSDAPHNSDLKHNMQLTVELLSCIAHNQEVHMLCSIGAINKHARASKSSAPGNKAIAGIRLCRHILIWLV